MPFNFESQPNFGSGLASGASETLKDFVMPQEAAKSQSKLALQMMNEKVRSEMMARETEMQQQAQLSQAAAQAAQERESIPADQYKRATDQINAYHTSLRNGEVPKPIDIDGITHPAAQAMVDRMITSSDSSGNLTHPMEIDGRQMLVTVNKAGNVLKKTDMGLTKEANKMIQQATAQYGEADALLKNIGDTTNGFIKATGMTELPAQYATLKFNQLAQLNPQAKAYFDNTTNYAMRIEKLITGNSRVPEALIMSAKNSIPNMDDTFDTANQKLANLRGIFDTIKSSTLNAYRTNPSEILKDFDQDHFGGLNPRDRTVSPAAGQPSLSGNESDYQAFKQRKYGKK